MPIGRGCGASRRGGGVGSAEAEGGRAVLGGVEERGWRWKSEAEGERLRQYWDGEGGLRARRVAEGMRLGMQADKAFEWFRKQKDKLNAMVREHVQRLPRDVGQALTARPNAKNGGRINKIMADEVARFKPNPFTYQDMSIRWKHGVATERIKQQRDLVKKALHRAEQLRARESPVVSDDLTPKRLSLERPSSWDLT